MTEGKPAKGRHGGKRANAGRKPEGDEPKIKRTYKLAPDVISKLEHLHKASGHAKANIIEYLIRQTGSLPEQLPQAPKTQKETT